MSEVYIIDGADRSALQHQIIEYRGKNEPLRLAVRGLGETSIEAAAMYVETILITEDRDPLLVDDEQQGPLPAIYIATGRAALNGNQPRAATLTIHERESITTPSCELEINEATDLG